ncbi:MAG: hypothetical protein RJA70_4908 [Pseudomonadota bacterium]|jgi:UPF0716 protein FxsA
MRWLLAFFVVVPLAELYLLLWLSGIIGFWPTVGITLVTGVVGGSLAKREGLRVYRQWSQAMNEWRVPEAGLVEAVLVLLGGVLLITPGVLTDVTGVLLLIPPSRRAVARWVKAHAARVIDARSAFVSGNVGPGFGASRDESGFSPPPGASTARERPRPVIDTSGESEKPEG